MHVGRGTLARGLPSLILMRWVRTCTCLTWLDVTKSCRLVRVLNRGNVLVQPCPTAASPLHRQQAVSRFRRFREKRRSVSHHREKANLKAFVTDLDTWVLRRRDHVTHIPARDNRRIRHRVESPRCDPGLPAGLRVLNGRLL